MNEATFGLVLSGGGAKGAYQTGLVKALADLDIQVTAVAGASIGALNGAVVAAAPNLQEAAVRLEEIWEELANTSPIKTKNIGYYSILLASAGLTLGTPGSVLVRIARLAAGIVGGTKLAGAGSGEDTDGLLSSAPLRTLLDRYIDIGKLGSGLDLYVSIYPAARLGGFHSLAEVVLADLGLRDTRLSEFRHVQAIPREEQKALLMASAALPVLYSTREVEGARYSDGGQGGWQKVQGNTPVTPLLDRGVKRIVVSHLTDGSPWSRHEYPDATIVEVRPKRPIARGSLDMISFNPASIRSWMRQGYEDTLITFEKLQRPLLAIRNVRERTELLKASLDGYGAPQDETEAAMSRIRAPKGLPPGSDS